MAAMHGTRLVGRSCVVHTTLQRWRSAYRSFVCKSDTADDAMRHLPYYASGGPRRVWPANLPTATLQEFFERLPVKPPWTDVRAGCLVGVAALPIALALGLASGVTPQQGVVTAIAAGTLIAILGSKGVYIAGPTVITAVIASDVVQHFGAGGLVLCTLMSGAVLAALAWVHLGRALEFIPTIFFSGIASAAAALIVIGQVPTLLGLPENLQVSNVFDIQAITSSFENVNWPTAGIAVLSIGLIVACRSLYAKAVATVLALIVATVVAQTAGFNLETVGSRFGSQGARNVQLVLPAIPVEHIQAILPRAFALALLVGVESMLTARMASSNVCEQDPASRDLVVQGAINIFCPVFGCLPAGVTLSNTANNLKWGGRTPAGGLIAASLMLFAFLVGARWIDFLPLCALAAVLVVAAYDLFAWRLFCELPSMDRWNATLLTVTFAIGISTNLTAAALIGTVVAAAAVVKGATNVPAADARGGPLCEPHSDDYPERFELPAGVDVIELTDRSNYLLALELRKLRTAAPIFPKAIILRLSRVTDIDATGYCLLWDYHQACKSRGIRLILSELGPQPTATLDKWRDTRIFGHQNICANFEQAVVRARIVADTSRIGPSQM